MLFKRKLSPELKRSLDVYLSRTYASEADRAVCYRESAAPASMPAPTYAPAPMAGKPSPVTRAKKAMSKPVSQAAETALMPELDRRLRSLDESFQEMLLRKIDEKGMRDSECYKRAGLDRKLFSKIRSNPQYKPKKTTAIAFCMALELEYGEAVELLRKAGYALSHSSKFDVITEYFLINRRYSIYELNLALYEYDQPLLN